MKSFVIISLIFLVCSCSRAPKEYRKTKNLNQIEGTTFVLPDSARWRIFDRDTTVILSQSPKIIVYFEGSGCTPCSLKELKRWTPIIGELKSYAQVVFILQTKANDPQIAQSLEEHNFNHPVLCDEIGQFERLNLLPTNTLQHVFILDGRNKVVLVSNPLMGTKTWKAFKATLKSLQTK
jgi:hypothetical protein